MHYQHSFTLDFLATLNFYKSVTGIRLCERELTVRTTIINLKFRGVLSWCIDIEHAKILLQAEDYIFSINWRKFENKMNNVD